jgi:sugar O-acyltransferase (sialic acid O-acetyltransferase NeuD family)
MSAEKPVVVFGANSLSSLAWFCLLHDSSRRVVAFTVDREYARAERHEGLPVVAFEDLPSIYPPADVDLLLPIGFTRINGLRMERFKQAKNTGYELISYVSTRASTWPGQSFGQNCLIYEHAIVQPFAEIGDNVIIRSAAHVSHHCVISDHSFVAAGVTMGGNVVVGQRCFIGLGAVIRDGIKLADRSFIGAGAVVVGDTEPDGVYVGNPARRLEKTSLAVTGG